MAPNEQSVCISQVGVRVSSAGEGFFGAVGEVGGGGTREELVGGSRVELQDGGNGSRDKC